MKVAILAGGLGTRLRPLISDVPKPMAPVNGRPFLEYLIRYLKSEGFGEFVLLVGYMAEKVRAYFGDGSSFGVRIEYSDDEGKGGTAGAVYKARDLLGEEFLLLNGDTYAEIDHWSLVELHRSRKAIATMALVRERGRKAGYVNLEGERVVGFRESETGEGLINAGSVVLSSEAFEYMRGRKSLEYEVYPELVRTGRVYGRVFNVEVFDIGTPESYLRFVEWTKRRFSGSAGP